MRMIRSIVFCSLAMFAAAFLYVAPSSASELQRHDHGYYSLTLTSIDYAIPSAFHVDAERLAVLHDESVKPVKSRSIGILKPVYQASLATDAQNLIDLRMRC